MCGSKKKKKIHDVEVGLPRFPESFCARTELRKLELIGHSRIRAIPAQISSLKKLKELSLRLCSLSSPPKELGELSELATLDLAGNSFLGDSPQDEAFPAELGRMKSLRELGLSSCGLRAVPAFVGGLESLGILQILRNDEQIYATLDVLIEGCPRLREVGLCSGPNDGPLTPESRAHLEAFAAKLLAKDPNAVVIFEESEDFSSSESEAFPCPFPFLCVLFFCHAVR